MINRMIRFIKSLGRKSRLLQKIWNEAHNVKARFFIKKNGFDVLKTFDQIMSELNMDYFLDYGTLLGIIRDGTFIAHDTDIDVGIIVNDKFNYSEWNKLMNEHQFVDLFSFYKKDFLVEKSYIFNKIKLDVFLYYPGKSERLVNYSSHLKNERQKDLSKRLIYKYSIPMISSFKRIEVEGVEFMIPENYVDILESKYGAGWRIPTKNWTEESYREFIEEITEDGFFDDHRYERR